MSHHRNGRGRCERRLHPPSLMLYNFDTGSSQLKDEHMTFLKSEVVPTLRGGGSVTVVGSASRLGAEARNQDLSERRAKATLDFLRRAAPHSFRAAPAIGVGEDQAAIEHYADGNNDERFRAVLVFLSSGPVPPPQRRQVPPPPRPPTATFNPPPDFRLPPGDTVFDSLGQILDVTGFISSMLELVLIGTCTVFLEMFGLISGFLSALVALPNAWSSGDRLAHFNGYCQGYWNALQDMALQYWDRSLDSIPESQWPALRRPVPHLEAINEDDARVVVREWRAGEREGCQRAYEEIVRLNHSPMDRQIAGAGRLIHIRFSGRMVLRSLAFRHGNHTAEYVRDRVNLFLEARGQRPWPVTR